VARRADSEAPAAGNQGNSGLPGTGTPPENGKGSGRNGSGPDGGREMVVRS
jgi:redox-sensing transcriptional repressor